MIGKGTDFLLPATLDVNVILSSVDFGTAKPE
jgi:hypothetical protein